MFNLIRQYKLKDIKDILDSDEYPVDFGITDLNISAFDLACTLSDQGQKRKDLNHKLLCLIFDYKPKLDHRDKLERTALHHAIRSNNLTAISFLMSQDAMAPKDLLKHMSFGNETPLMKASEHCSLEIIQLLLNKDADPFVKNKKGRTADLYAM